MSTVSREYVAAVAEAARLLGEAQKELWRLSPDGSVQLDYGRVTLKWDGEAVAVLVPADWDDTDYAIEWLSAKEEE